MGGHDMVCHGLNTVFPLQVIIYVAYVKYRNL